MIEKEILDTIIENLHWIVGGIATFIGGVWGIIQKRFQSEIEAHKQSRQWLRETLENERTQSDKKDQTIERLNNQIINAHEQRIAHQEDMLEEMSKTTKDIYSATNNTKVPLSTMVEEIYTGNRTRRIPVKKKISTKKRKR